MAALRAIAKLQMVDQKSNVISAVCARKFATSWGNTEDPCRSEICLFHFSA